MAWGADVARVVSWRAIGVAAVVVAAFLLAALLAPSGDDPPPDGGPDTLRVPPAGEAMPAYLRDGTPVFVARLPSGEVRVHGAWSPHLGTKLLVWCESSERFEDLFHGSRFDLGGRWHSGPSPTGLVPYAARPQGGEVLVGPRGRPPDRQHEAGLREEQPGPSCGEDGLEGPARLHEPRDLAAVHDLVGEDRFRWTVAHAEPLGDTRTRLCDPQRAPDGTCPDGSPTVPLPLNAGEQALLLRGLGTDDVTVLRHADPASGG